MTTSAWLQTSTAQLDDAGIATARLDCLVLLEDAIGKNRAWILAHPEYKLTEASLTTLQGHIARRVSHEPLSYIRQRSEFYGREFYINHHVLEPRPESEAIIEQLKSHYIVGTIVDVGTGSGALAITAKLELPQATVIGVDIDPKCLAVSRKNAAKLNAEITFMESDLVAQIADAQVLLCNLPYVPLSHTINQAAMQEPTLAIFGGDDGLDLYRSLFQQIKNQQLSPKFVITEALPPSHNELTDIALKYSYKLVTTDDFVQVFTREN